MSEMNLNSKPEEGRRRGWLPWAIGGALVVLTLVVFAQTGRFQFLNFDDNLYVSENPRLAQGLSLRGLAWAGTANLTEREPHAEYWAPLTLISRLADVQFFGLDAGAHHRTNVWLHLAAGLVLFGALRALLGSDWRSGLIAALFLIHSLHVEPVAWLSARKDILNGLFFFGTIWAYARYARRPGGWRYAWVFLLFLCANMAKPMAVSLPFVLLALDHWPLGRLRAPWFDRAGRRLVLEKVPLLLLAAAVAWLAVIDQRQHGAMGDRVLFPLWSRVGSAAISYGAYLGQTFWPVNLAALYPHPGTGLDRGWAVVCALGLVGLSGLCVGLAKRRPWLLVGWVWFVVVLLPVSGLVQIGEMARADRYTYVALVGIFLLVVQEGAEWLARAGGERRRWQSVAAVLFGSCFRRIGDGGLGAGRGLGRIVWRFSGRRSR